MKLEKREITLNETDSVKDVAYTQKNLLTQYVNALEYAERKSVREELLRLMKQTGEDLCFTRDFMRGEE